MTVAKRVFSSFALFISIRARQIPISLLHSFTVCLRMTFLRRVDLHNFNLEAGFFISIARRWRYPFVFVDTEFPGTIHRSEKPFFLLSPEERYALLKANVDDLRPIQVGITLCYTDADKSLVWLGTAAGAGYGDTGTSRFAFTWQFDLRDFDVRLHPHAPDSVALLESSGLDLSRTRRMGVPSTWIARLLLDSGLIGRGSAAKWVAFQGGYDFAILLKSFLQLTMPPWLARTPARLPPTLSGFSAFTRCLFGSGIYDVKCLMRSCDGLFGGLERVAEQLRVKRAAGKTHQAGSDSLLTCQVFFKITELYFRGRTFGGCEDQIPFKGLLFGL
ncbi:hypothetical protein HPP92_025455 [Vanilla planifolia]|uniref:poly(A)-specific ribonuclease n=1 Tax=Vanilla planifolia TaxID=51239 RepID=A0A835PJ08_VANPL|nr:hypothetical protein HPP92_025755 [Vanilla planifolia]KAG0454151.1 hypothetical protein HPP92_025455 [Vanilla planifolia]